jgi:hypothetical protein
MLFAWVLRDRNKILFPFSLQPGESYSLTIMLFVFLVYILYEGV